MRCLLILSLGIAANAAVAQQSSTGTGAFNLAQVMPGGGRINGGGISYVTRPTPTATAMATAQGFFAAGGVTVGGANAASPPGAPGAPGTFAAGPSLIASGTGARSVAPAVPSDRELIRLATAANRGDAKAAAQLSAAGRAMLARDEAKASASVPNSVAARRTPSR